MNSPRAAGQRESRRGENRRGRQAARPRSKNWRFRCALRSGGRQVERVGTGRQGGYTDGVINHYLIEQRRIARRGRSLAGRSGKCPPPLPSASFSLRLALSCCDLCLHYFAPVVRCDALPCFLMRRLRRDADVSTIPLNLCDYYFLSRLTYLRPFVLYRRCRARAY
jgi:hypothetical protein